MGGNNMKEISTLTHSYESAFSPDDQFIAMVTTSKVNIYKTMDFSLYHSIPLRNPGFIQFLANSNLICITNTSGTLYLYNMKTMVMVKRLVSAKNRKFYESDCILHNEQLYKLANVKGENTLLAYDLRSNSFKECLKFDGYYANMLQHVPSKHEILILNVDGKYGEKEQLIIYNYETLEKRIWGFQEEASDYTLNLYTYKEEIYGYSMGTVVKMKGLNEKVLIVDQEVFNVQDSMITDIQFSEIHGLRVIVTTSKVYITDINFQVIQEIEIELGNHAKFNHAEDLLILGSWSKNKIFKI